MADQKITDLPLGTDIADDDELLYIDKSDNTAGPNGTDKRVLIGSLRNIAARNITTTDLINSSLNVAVGEGVLTQGFYTKGDGGDGSWILTSETGTPSQTPAELGDAKFTDAGGRVWILVAPFNVKALGADPTGFVDSTEVFNAHVNWAKSIAIDDSSVSLDWTGGKFSVSSVNLTNLRYIEGIKILSWGSTFIGNTANKAMFDLVGSRFIWVYGLVTKGFDSALPTCGIQMGNSDQVPTCGNNKFFMCQTQGSYSESGLQNYGSETTQYYSCRFYNNNSDATKYAFIGDGRAGRTYQSDYAGVPVDQAASSFTNNYFYSCQFRSESGGKAVFLAQTNGWTFDRGCYFLSYQDAPMTIYTASSARNAGLDIGGLFETAQDPGLPYLIKFTGNGTVSTLRQINLRLRNVNANTSVFHNESAGNVEMSGSIEASGFKYSGVTFFGTGGNISGKGLNLTTSDDDVINLADLTSYYGMVQCNSVDTITYPIAGKAYVFDNSGVSITPESRITLSSQWSVSPVVSGAITVSSKFITISENNAVITDIVKTYGGTMEIVIRNSTNTNLTITYDSSKIRLNSKADVLLSQHQSIRLANINDTIWQQV